jgi:uncharacterized delta-60 repeat protein
LASGLASATALAAQGDLDPSFGDVGRVHALPGLYGPAWSIQPQGEDDSILAGGYYYNYYYSYYDGDYLGFAERLSGDGSVDPVFGAASGLANVEVRDLVVAGDGMVTGAGRSLVSVDGSDRTVLTVFRLGANGTPDPAFGTDGRVNVPSLGLVSTAGSLVLDPDGRIVVAGVSDGRLIVLRLQADGVLDPVFADSGVFVGPETDGYRLPKITHGTGGGYRVTTHGPDCAVLALTPGGAVDSSFGTSGMAAFEASSACSALAVQADGRLLVAGQRGSEAFAARLLESGQPDATFDAGALGSVLERATALEVSDTGSVYVAGLGPSGDLPDALVLRMHADGAIDAAFGNGGSSVIDLSSQFGSWPTINDIALQGDKILLAGGYGGWWQWPFAARLWATGGTDGPGVLGFTRPFGIEARQQDGNAIVKVRRTGGRAGPVSVLIRTRPSMEGWGPVATPGEDYTATESTLTWMDGDIGEKQLVIPLLPDAPGAVAEEYESFEVEISDAQGGAGLGTASALVTISPDGDPGGQFSIAYASAQNVWEAIGTVRVIVSRNYYTSGTVSVTVGAVSGDAVAGEDFIGDPVTLTWAAGESDEKHVDIKILNDVLAEEAEHFSVELSEPTGGAILGPQSKVSFTIARNDQTAPSTSSNSGGGAVGPLSLLLLALVEMIRRVSRWAGWRRRLPGAPAG